MCDGRLFFLQRHSSHEFYHTNSVHYPVHEFCTCILYTNSAHHSIHEFYPSFCPRKRHFLWIESLTILANCRKKLLEVMEDFWKQLREAVTGKSIKFVKVYKARVDIQVIKVTKFIKDETFVYVRSLLCRNDDGLRFTVCAEKE